MSLETDLRQVKLIALHLALADERDEPRFGACQRALRGPLGRLGKVEARDVSALDADLIRELRSCLEVVTERTRPLQRLRVRRVVGRALQEPAARLVDDLCATSDHTDRKGAA